MSENTIAASTPRSLTARSGNEYYGWTENLREPSLFACADYHRPTSAKGWLTFEVRDKDAKGLLLSGCLFGAMHQNLASFLPLAVFGVMLSETTVATCTAAPLLTPLEVTTAVRLPLIAGGAVMATVSEVAVAAVTLPPAPLLKVTMLFDGVVEKPRRQLARPVQIRLYYRAPDRLAHVFGQERRVARRVARH